VILIVSVAFASNYIHYPLSSIEPVYMYLVRVWKCLTKLTQSEMPECSSYYYHCRPIHGSVSVEIQKEDVYSHLDLEIWTYTHC